MELNRPSIHSSFYQTNQRELDSLKLLILECKQQKQKKEFEKTLSRVETVYQEYLKEAKPDYHKKSEIDRPYSLLISEEKTTYILLKSRSRENKNEKFPAIAKGGYCSVTFCYDFEKKQYKVARSLQTKGCDCTSPTEDEIEINNKLKEDPNYFATGEVFQYESKTKRRKIDKTTFIMEYFEGGCLRKAVKQGKIRQLSSEKRIGLIKHILCGIHLLHTKYRYRHNDIKLDNVLLTKDFEPRLTDFGFACSLDKEPDIVGTVLYLPPEVENSEKGDIWAFGVLLLCLKYEGHKEWQGNAKTEQGFIDTIRKPKLLKEKLEPLLQRENCQNPKHLDSIIYKCLTHNSNVRPTAEKLLQLLEEVEIG